jgi:hypothetical protein
MPQERNFILLKSGENENDRFIADGKRRTIKIKHLGHLADELGLFSSVELVTI